MSETDSRLGGYLLEQDVEANGARGDVRHRSSSLIELAVSLFTLISTCCGRRVPGAAAAPLLNPPIADEPSPAEAVAVPSLPHRFLMWVRVSLCGSASDAVDEAALLHSFDGLFGGYYEPLPPADGLQVSSITTGNTTDEIGDGNAAVTWKEFMKDGHVMIKWMLTIALLFVPAKLFMVLVKLLLDLYAEPKSFHRIISDLYDDAKKSYFPQIFLSSIILYSGFFMGAKLLRNPTLKFSFEVTSMIVGVGSTIVVLFFLGGDEWIWVLGALICFLIIFGICKVWDCLH